MKKIDVTKCEYYDDYYKTCSNFSRCSDDEPYCDPINFKCSYYISNIEKQLQHLEVENEELKEFKNGVAIDFKDALARIIRKQEQIQKLQQCLDEIEEIAKDFHLSMIIFHKGATHEMADRIDYYLDKIKQLIKQGKESEWGK